VTSSPEGELNITRELGGKGFCFVIDKPQLSPADKNAFLEQIRSLYFGKKETL
jgi:hypothetical protein